MSSLELQSLSTECEMRRNRAQAVEAEQVIEVAQGSNDSASAQRSASSVVYPTGIRLVSLVVALDLCVFVIGLVKTCRNASFVICMLTHDQDGTITANAVPRITDEFGSTNQSGWYTAAYRVASCASQLFQGQLLAIYNLKPVLLINLILFEAGALLSGAAPSSNVFIVGRAITGLGFAGVTQGCLV